MVYTKTHFLNPDQDTELTTFATEKGFICIEIHDSSEFPHWINLNRDTAEAFVKYLQEQIKDLQDEG